MRLILLLAFILTSGGCTTLETIQSDPAQLRQRISSGELLKPGDRIFIITTDGRAHRLEFSGIGAGVIEGKPESVPLDQVISLQRRQLSPGKTIALVSGIAAAALLGAAIHSGLHPSVGVH